MPEAPPSSVRLTLPSTLASVDQVEERALLCAVEAGFDSDTASNIAMVAREAAVNAVVHGNAYSASKSISASCTIAAQTLTIAITDEGAGLNPEAIPDPLAPENVMRTSGRGVFLMRAFVDEVHFRQLDPGTEVTLVKRLPKPAPKEQTT